MEQAASLLSIGALSRATGVPTETLRTWERRYGFPRGERNESGRRRYSLRTLERLRLGTRAVALGYPPSNALSADEQTLRELVGEAESAPEVAAEAEVLAAIEPWLEPIKRYDGPAFDRELRSAWAEYGGLAFIERYTAPFVVEIGRRWARGEISVAQEHFASERLREFLVQRWRPISDASTGATFVCATLPGEQHVLGLHMAALALALADARIIFLGASVPPTDIAMSALQTTVAAVVLSASSAVEEQLVADTALLRAALPNQTPIIAGGTGFLRARPVGVTVFESFGELQHWCSRHDANAGLNAAQAQHQVEEVTSRDRTNATVR